MASIQQAKFWISEHYRDVIDTQTQFGWCNNRLSIRLSTYLDHFIDQHINILQWNYAKSSSERLNYDFYIGQEINSLVIIDDFYKFSSWRLKSLELYDNHLPIRYDLKSYMEQCKIHLPQADKYQFLKIRKDFPFEGGTSAKNAMNDLLLDLKPVFSGLNPTIRLTVFELEKINSSAGLISLLNERVNL